MKLLMLTRKVDQNDALAGFTYNWVKKIGENVEKLYVIAWQKSGRGDLPQNIEIIFLPENKLVKIFVLPWKVFCLVPKTDGVFCHMNPEYTILSWLPAKIFRKKIISWYTHQAITWRRRLMELMADKILTASVESFRKPKFPNKVKVLGHGIDIELFNATDKQKDERGIFRIITVGRISPTKDYESIIKAIDLLNNKSVQLKIIGDVILAEQKNYFNQLKEIVEVMGLKEQVEFAGWVANKDLAPYHQKADLFINLSGTGSLDKAVLEAMACGCLILTSNEAFKPILPLELMVEKNNPGQLVEKIKWLMNLPEEEKTKLRKQMRDEVVKNHNLDNLAKKVVAQFYAK